MTDCFKAKILLEELRQLKDQLTHLDGRVIRESMSHVQSLIATAKETVSQVEAIALLEIERLLNLREQYKKRVNSLKQLGLIRGFTYNKIFWFGFKGVDHSFYRLPSYREIIKELKNNPDWQRLLITKFHQGFTKLLIVPFGLSLNDFLQLTKQNLLRFHQEQRIRNLDLKRPMIHLEIVPRHDMDVQAVLDNSQLAYYPLRYDAGAEDVNRHRGRSKIQILEGQKRTIVGGFNILLVEDNDHVPSQEETQTLPKNIAQIKREQLAPGLSAKQYLEKLQSDPCYDGEIGLTLEDWITLFLTKLQEDNKLTDLLSNRNSKLRGALSLLLGSVRFSYGYVGGGAFECVQDESGNCKEFILLGGYDYDSSWEPRSVRTAVHLLSPSDTMIDNTNRLHYEKTITLQSSH